MTKFFLAFTILIIAVWGITEAQTDCGPNNGSYPFCVHDLETQ